MDIKKNHKLFFIYMGGVNLSVIKISYISPYHHFLIWQITRWNLLKEVSVLNRPSDHVFWFLLLIQIMMRVNVFHTCFRASEQRNVWLIKNFFDKCWCWIYLHFNSTPVQLLIFYLLDVAMHYHWVCQY